MKPSIPPYASIALDSPISAQNDGFPVKMGVESICEQSFSTTLGPGGQNLRMGEDSVGVLATGSTANSVCLKWLVHHYLLSGKQGLPRISTFLAALRC